jgi:glycosyltransferase involved in cell wall biosynthesis
MRYAALKSAGIPMNTDPQPLVTVVTPMYNNVQYVKECIESVRSQTYRNWHYVIVNNCSTDGSADIAHGYAKQDSRITVHDNQQFLPVVANHNAAMRQLSPASKYCKMVFSDDWIFPRCLEEMVAMAEAHPSAGIVGAFGLQGQEIAVKWAGLPYPSELVPGRELGRRYFLRGAHDYVFGTSHSLLFRSDLVRGHDPFFNESSMHSDVEICIDLLRSCDFSFVHQILTFTRERTGSLTEFARHMNTSVGCRLYELVTYGSDFLTPEEFKMCRDRLLAEYYNYLALSLLLGRAETEFWDMHKRKLSEAGVQFSRARVMGSLLKRIGRAASNPRETIVKLQAKSMPTRDGFRAEP